MKYLLVILLFIGCNNLLPQDEHKKPAESNVVYENYSIKVIKLTVDSVEYLLATWVTMHGVSVSIIKHEHK